MNEPCYYRVSVKGIVIDETGRFLLAREDNGKWEMLGGGLDHDEDPKKCLKREIREETGLQLTYISPCPIYFVTCKKYGGDNYIANIIYEIKLKNLDFIPSDECQELRFFSASEARNEALFSNVEALLDVYDPAAHI